jgi:hypothetical protein
MNAAQHTAPVDPPAPPDVEVTHVRRLSDGRTLIIRRTTCCQNPKITDFAIDGSSQIGRRAFTLALELVLAIAEAGQAMVDEVGTATTWSGFDFPLPTGREARLNFMPDEQFVRIAILPPTHEPKTPLT